MDELEDDIIGILAVVILCLAQLGNDQHRAALLATLSSLIRDKIIKVDQFVERTVPQMLPTAFRRLFRMYPQAVNKLIHFILNCPRMHERRLSILFGVSEEAFIRATDDVMLSLIDNIDTFIRWPQRNHYRQIATNFDDMGRWFPNVIGCLDGCHLEFEVGRGTRKFYRNYKGYYSINLMAIVTYNMSFLDIFVGWPGRSHDSRVFRESPIYSRLAGLMHFRRLLPTETFSILADKGFPIALEVMTPYKGHPTTLTAGQLKFNRNLNSKRQTVERAFSLLKRRFRRLKLLNQRSHEKAVNVVMAACILHNFCIGEDDNIDHYMNSVTTFPQLDVMNTPPMPLVTDRNTQMGQLKRHLLMEMMRRM